MKVEVKCATDGQSNRDIQQLRKKVNSSQVCLLLLCISYLVKILKTTATRISKQIFASFFPLILSQFWHFCVVFLAFCVVFWALTSATSCQDADFFQSMMYIFIFMHSYTYTYIHTLYTYIYIHKYILPFCSYRLGTQYLFQM